MTQTEHEGQLQARRSHRSDLHPHWAEAPHRLKLVGTVDDALQYFS